MLGDELIREAAAFARKAHQGQMRKYTGMPYISHPSRTAVKVAQHPIATSEMVAAAWLHDVVEDTLVEIDDIRELFGDRVADLVSELTNPTKGSKEKRVARKAKERAYLIQASREAQIIKMFDRIDNLLEMGEAPEKFKRLYGQESVKLFAVLSDADPYLARLGTRIAEKLIQDADAA